MQPGNFDLVGTIFYEVNQNAYQSVFFNGTIEVVEASGVISIESVFLVTLGIALLVLLGLWIHGQIQQKLSKVYPVVNALDLFRLHVMIIMYSNSGCCPTYMLYSFTSYYMLMDQCLARPSVKDVQFFSSNMLLLLFVA